MYHRYPTLTQWRIVLMETPLLKSNYMVLVFFGVTTIRRNQSCTTNALLMMTSLLVRVLCIGMKWTWIKFGSIVDILDTPNNLMCLGHSPPNTLHYIYSIALNWAPIIGNMIIETHWNLSLVFPVCPKQISPRVSRSAGGVSASGWRPRHPPGKSDPYLDPQEKSVKSRKCSMEYLPTCTIHLS